MKTEFGELRPTAQPSIVTKRMPIHWGSAKPRILCRCLGFKGKYYPWKPKASSVGNHRFAALMYVRDIIKKEGHQNYQEVNSAQLMSGWENSLKMNHLVQAIARVK